MSFARISYMYKTKGDPAHQFFALVCWILKLKRVVTWHPAVIGPTQSSRLLLSHFLAVHDVELVAGTKDDRPFRHFAGFQFIDV